MSHNGMASIKWIRHVMPLDRLSRLYPKMHWEVRIFHTLTQLILMKLYFGGIHFIVPTYSEKNNIIIMNSSSNAFCRQLFMNLNILPIQSQYIYLILLFVTKIKTNFCLTHKYIKSIQGKLWSVRTYSKLYNIPKGCLLLRN